MLGSDDDVQMSLINNQKNIIREKCGVTKSIPEAPQRYTQRSLLVIFANIDAFYL